MSQNYDAIVVGTRCAGSSTAMLLARKGYRVLAVDKASFPSDTLSTHILHPKAAAALARWGLLERLRATGCPPIYTYSYQYSFDGGPCLISGTPGTPESPVGYCPRRTILDKLLIDAAAEAGAEVREDFSMEELIFEGDAVIGIKGRSRLGASVQERAKVVIGADGRHSAVAEAVGAQRYHARPPLAAGYYTYWSNLPMGGRFENYVRGTQGFGAVPTHGDLTLIIAGWPRSDFAEKKRDVEGNYMKVIELVPEFAERLRSARREAGFAGASLPNFFRKPFGPGWALVGDSAYIKDPITAQGMSDAFRDAELCATALDEWFANARGYSEALSDYQSSRDEQALPMYELTCAIATLSPPPPDKQRLLYAMKANQAAMNSYVQMLAGTISPAQFEASESIQSVTRAAEEGGSVRDPEVAVRAALG